MMDLEEDWEYLPDAATYLLRDSTADDADAITIPVRSLPSVFNMDYFSTTTDSIPILFPSSPTHRAKDVVRRLLHDTSQQQDVEVEEAEEREVDIVNSNTPNAAAAAASNTVFFKSGISKESVESVDMKFLDSVSSPTATSPRKTRSLFDVNWIGEGIIGDDDYVINDDLDEGMIGGLNFWKLGFGGIGAICSFGVAAATICLFLLGNNHKAKRNHKLRFQIDDQSMKHAVQQATKFNEAMLGAVRGVPLNRAHITYGGYYDNSL